MLFRSKNRIMIKNTQEKKQWIPVLARQIGGIISPTRSMPATNEHKGGEFVRRDFCGWSALGPISIYIEFVLGFHHIDAFTKTVDWEKPAVQGKIGIENLRFGNVVTDIVAENDKCLVTSNAPYTLTEENE